MIITKWSLSALACWCGLVYCQREPERFSWFNVYRDPVTLEKTKHSNWYFNFMVGIADHGYFRRTGKNRRVCAGVIIKYDLVLTSAKPMRTYDTPTGHRDLKVGYYHDDQALYRQCWWTQVRNIKFHEENRDMFSSIDPFRTNADIAVLSLTEEMRGLSNERQPKLFFRVGYAAIPAMMPWNITIVNNLRIYYPNRVGAVIFPENDTMVHLSFGSMTYDDIRSYRELHAHEYLSPEHLDVISEVRLMTRPPPSIVSCKDIIMEGWGKFICVKTRGKGCDAGSALIHGWNTYYFSNTFKFLGRYRDYKVYNRNFYTVFGICSFTVEVKGQKYMAFTDLRHKENKDFVEMTMRFYREWE